MNDTSPGRTYESRDAESGFTLIEVLVAIALFSVISITFYSFMFAGVRGGETTQSLVRISEEARAGFNRMVRDTREAQELTPVSSTEFEVRIDFDGDGLFNNTAAEVENLTYEIQGRNLLLNDQLLMSGIQRIGARPFISYASNLLEYDWNENGVTECLELDQASDFGILGVGNDNGVCDEGEQEFLSEVNFALRVRQGDRISTFFAQAQLRNRR